MPNRIITRRVRLDQIRAHHTNIRCDLGDLRPLADSIRRHGLLVPLVLEADGDAYRIRDGHRRLAACHLLGLDHVRAEIHTHRLGDADWLTQAVETNHQRRTTDLSERQATIARMRAQGLTFRQIAAAYGVHPSTIGRWLDPRDPDDAALDDPATDDPATDDRDLAPVRGVPSPTPRAGRTRRRRPPIGPRVREVVERWSARDLDDQAAAILADLEAVLAPQDDTGEGVAA